MSRICCSTGAAFAKSRATMLPAVAGHLGLKLSTLAAGSSLQGQLTADQSSDVVLAGRVSDDALSDAYRNAWAFATMSDHEGYCVPLVEALAFGLPVFANGVTAIPETLGAAGQLIDKSKWSNAVEAVAHLLNDKTAYEKAQHRSIQEFSRRYEFSASVKAHQVAIESIIVAHRSLRHG